MPIFKRLITRLIRLERLYKQLIVYLNDCIISLLCLWFAYSIRYELFRLPLENEIITYFIAVLIFTIVFLYFKIYQVIHQYLGLSTLRKIIIATLISGVFFTITLFIFQFDLVPRSVGIIYCVLFLITILLSRIITIYLVSEFVNVVNVKNVLIYGLGENAINASKVLERSIKYNLRGFIDYKSTNHGKLINNVSIYRPEQLESLIERHNINSIIIALENTSSELINEVIQEVESFNVEIKKIPKNFSVLGEAASLSDFKELDIGDLIDRKISIRNDKLDNISKKIVFVSGAGGSIGSEICREIIFHEPSVIILFDHSEFNLYTIEGELLERISNKNLKIKIISCLGDIRDKKTVENTFTKHNPDIIFHVAAYKHVPIVENNITEAITNNVLGTKNLVTLALKFKIQNFTLISTDKAVRPTNIMGATKRLAELLIHAISKSKELNTNNINFSIIRFGNVLGSSGSVVPLFYKQINEGGPITLTDEKMTRYFMTIREAAILVLQSTLLQSDNEIFVLDMGMPIKILDLAKKMIKLSGLTEKNKDNPNGNIEIKITGLRPGEKLYEELIVDNNMKKTDRPHILKAREKIVKYNEIIELIDEISNFAESSDIRKIKSILMNEIIGYRPKDNEV